MSAIPLPLPFTQESLAGFYARFLLSPTQSDTGDCALKHAAVAIVVKPTDMGAAFLITRRAAHLRAHPHQWALPGGRCDEGESAVAAALRELREEVGASSENLAFIGALDDYPTRSGYRITPLIFWTLANLTLTANPDEVASIHWIDLSDILAEGAARFTPMPETGRKIIALAMDGDFIHAPTAALLYQFREMLLGRTTRVRDLEQPRFAWR